MKKKNFYIGILLTSAMFVLGSTGSVFAVDTGWTTGYPEYDEILSKYYEGVSSHWNTQGFQENDLDYLFGYDPSINTLGYCLKDIDDDGTPELFVGRTDDQGIYMGMLYDFYTITDGKLVKVLESGERDRFYLCENNEIAEEGSGSAVTASHTYYNYKNGKLEKIEEVLFDAYQDEQNPWFYVAADSEDIYSTPITEEEGNSIISSYEYVTDLYQPVATLINENKRQGQEAETPDEKNIEITSYMETYKDLVEKLGMSSTDSWQFLGNDSYVVDQFYLEWEENIWSMKNEGAPYIKLYGFSLGDSVETVEKTLLEKEWVSYYSDDKENIYLAIINDKPYMISLRKDENNNLSSWYFCNWPEGDNVGEFFAKSREKQENGE